MSLFPRPPGAAEELPPPGSLLFAKLRAARPGILPPDQEPDPDSSDQTAKDLVALGLPISKSGAPFFPPPPQPSVVPPSLSRSWLDIASLVAPNIVDYFTKPAPPPAPFPSTPGKIPPVDANPYFGPALVEAVNLGTAILGSVEGLGLGLAAKAPMLAMPGLSAAELAAARGTLVAGPIRLVGRSAEEAVGIPLNAPKPSIEITSSGAIRYPDRLTELTIEEVKNVKHLAFTQQMSDYLEHAQENGLTFILHTRPQTTYSRPLQALIDAGHIVQKDIPGIPK